MPYLFDAIVAYEDDDEYRASICKVFQMQEYDDALLSKGMDELFAITSCKSSFANLYVAAAGKMMSEDPELGLAVLFSYDYFAKFHTCFQNEAAIDEIIVAL